MSHHDQTGAASPDAPSVGADRTDVGWPLIDRRRPAPEGSASGTTLLLWPFRLAALGASIYRARSALSEQDAAVIAALAVVAAITAAACLRPRASAGGRAGLRLLALELAAVTLAVVVSGAWGSPVAAMLVPAGMAAGVALGARLALIGVAAAVTVISAQHIALDPNRSAVEEAFIWTAAITIPAYLCGLVRQTSTSATRQREQALARVSQLTDANSLLFALQRVARTLPSSLDLDEVVDSTLDRVRALVPSDSVALYLAHDADPMFERYRSSGDPVADTIDPLQAPATIRTALDAPRTVLISTLDPSVALTEGGRSALYTVLRARSTVVGLLTIEARDPAALDRQHAELVHGLAESFGVAIDNARLFRRIRAASADEERARIARDLHDRVGSSLAFLGFEIDRARTRAGHDPSMTAALDELRHHLTEVVRDVRESLHDLRSDVTEDRPLAEALRTHLVRIDDRSDLATRLDVEVAERPPVAVERELWRIALEAMTNVERHGRADVLSVRYRADDDRVVLAVSDDGVGFNLGDRRADRYGMTGMRERADTIGAVVRVDSSPGAGTTVTVELDRLGRDLR